MEAIMSAIAMGDDNQREAAEYEAAATLASLISAPISSDDSDETNNAPSWSRSNEVESDVGNFVISPNDSHDATNNNVSEEKKLNGGTRKFTRNDEVQLIRGILKYGNSSWKKIWQETPELQHIKHSALKDRGRSKRFQNVLKRAQEDPTLLDRPFELLGDEHSNWYEKASTSHRAKSISPTSNHFNAAVVGGADEPLSTCGSLQDNEDDALQKKESNSGSSAEAAAVEKEGNDNKKSKPEKAAASVTKTVKKESHDTSNNVSEGRILNITRKFTRNDEVQLIRGILKYGNSSWKKIWQDTPELQHITHSGLKDRGRSKRFQSVLKRAQEDPTLLDRPFELLGDEHSHWYEKATNATPKNDDFNASAGGAEPPLSTSACDSLQENKNEEDSIQKKESIILSSSPNTRAATKRKAAAAVETEGIGNKKSKPENAAASATKKSLERDTRGLRTHNTRGDDDSKESKPEKAAASATEKSLERDTKGLRIQNTQADGDNRESKPVKSAASATKKSPERNTKRLKTNDAQVDDFPGWTVKIVKRKDSNLFDRSWSHPRLDGVIVRSRVGMREMIEKMETNRIDVSTAYEILMSEGKRKYFIGTLKS